MHTHTRTHAHHTQAHTRHPLRNSCAGRLAQRARPPPARAFATRRLGGPLHQARGLRLPARHRRERRQAHSQARPRADAAVAAPCFRNCASTLRPRTHGVGTCA
eukprot:6204209-Pleurochrysis_carterae.AAC.1